jgi:hypothetical protein
VFPSPIFIGDNDPVGSPLLFLSFSTLDVAKELLNRFAWNFVLGYLTEACRPFRVLVKTEQNIRLYTKNVMCFCLLVCCSSRVSRYLFIRMNTISRNSALSQPFVQFSIYLIILTHYWKCYAVFTSYNSSFSHVCSPYSLHWDNYAIFLLK